MIESEIVAPGSVKGVLSGKHYNRSVRVHKLIYEAIQRMRFEAFEKSLESSAFNHFDSVGISVLEDSERELFTEICTSKQVNDVKRAYDIFVENEAKRILRLPSGPNISTWFNYSYFTSEQRERQIGNYTLVHCGQ